MLFTGTNNHITDFTNFNDITTYQVPPLYFKLLHTVITDYDVLNTLNNKILPYYNLWV